MTAALARPLPEEGGAPAEGPDEVAGPAGSRPGMTPLSYERARRQADPAREAVWVTEVDGGVIHWNQTAEQLHGWTVKEVFGVNVLDVVIDASSRDTVHGLLARAATTQACSGEATVRRRDGSTFPASITFAPLEDGAQGVTAVVWVSRDITAQRAAEEEQRRTHALLQAQLDASPEGVMVFMGGRVAAVNSRFRELFRVPDLAGITVDEVAQTFEPLLEPATIAQLRDEKGGEFVEFNTRDRQIIQRSMRAIPGPNGETGRVCFYRDVTEARRAQDRDHLQARLATALAQLRSLAIEAHDVETLERDALPLIQQALDAAAVEVAVRDGDGGLRTRASVGPLGLPALTALLPAREESYGVLRVHAPPPRTFSAPEIAFVDACASALAAALERARADAALRESERRWRELVAQLPDGIAIVAGGGYLVVNDALVQILGQPSREALLAQPYEAVMGAENVAQLRQRAQELTTADGPLPPAEYTLRRADGSTIVIEAVAMPMRYEGRAAALAIVRDVTERRQLQARLMLADRMASVGTLAAGVAHELNNPLAYVSGNLNFALGELTDLGASGADADRLSELHEALSEARDGAERMRQIIRDLKGFSRVDDQVRTPVDVRRGVETAINMAFNEVKQRARLERRLAEVPLVLADDGRISQVVLNLLVNAAQAIPEGHADQHTIEVATSVRADGWVELSVKDDGGGIAPEHLPRIFDPFFTTKPLGVGTGLGLSVCHNLVRALGGTIDVTSAVGQGTRFRVALPPVAEAPVPAGATPSRPVTRAGRLLVVDDEPMILAVFRRTFGKTHQVVLAQGADEALTRLAAGERFDLIFCDVLMPGMTGAELFARLQAEYPDQAAATIFMSGGAFTPATVEFLASVPNPKIDKPFAPEKVEALVAQRLGVAA